MSRINEEQRMSTDDTAISKKKLFAHKFEGKLIRITGNKLVMTNQEGKECSHILANDVKLSIDGTACRVEDLKTGTAIRVTTRKNNPQAAMGVDSV